MIRGMKCVYIVTRINCRAQLSSIGHRSPDLWRRITIQWFTARLEPGFMRFAVIITLVQYGDGRTHIWTPEPGIGPDCLCQVRMTGIWSHAKWFHTWPLGAATVVHSHPCSIPHTAAKRGWPGFQLAYSSIEIIHDIKSLLNNHIEFEFHNLSRNNHLRNRRETDDAMPWWIHIRDWVQQARLGMQIFLFAHWGRPAPFEPTFRKAHDPKVFLSAIFFRYI